MLTEIEQQRIAEQTRIAQVVVAAILFGAATTLGISLFLAPVAGPLPGLPLLGWVLAAAGVIAWVAVPVVITSSARRKFMRTLPQSPTADPNDLTRIDSLLAVYHQRLVAGLALLEGAILFNLVIYLLMAPTLNLGLAIALMVLAASQFPTRQRIERWVRAELETRQALGRQV